MRKVLLIISFGVLAWWHFSKREVKPLYPIPVVKMSPVQCGSSPRAELRFPASEEKQIIQERPWSGEELRERWGVQEYHEMHASEVESPSGTTVTYTFSQDGIPIIGMEARIVKNREGAIVEEESAYRPLPRIDFNPRDVEERAENIKSEVERYEISEVGADSLVIVTRENLAEGELAFSTRAVDPVISSQPTQLLLRVEDGQILQKGFLRAEFGH